MLGAVKTYLHKGQERISKLLQNMIDFQIQLVGSEKGPPSFEDRVRHL